MEDRGDGEGGAGEGERGKGSDLRFEGFPKSLLTHSPTPLPSHEFWASQYKSGTQGGRAGCDRLFSLGRKAVAQGIH